MSVTDVSLGVEDSQENVNVNKNVCVVDDVSSVEQQNLESPRCFVCDIRVQGRRYALATCKTRSSRARVVEKLGELVGERYVVVISEDDVICRSCANLINTLDRLESEMKGVKGAVLRFLERKYSLAEGELLSCSDIPRPGQPPQITRSGSRRIDYHSRKRGPVNADDVNFSSKRSKKSNVWMQCDTCRYTTLCNTFMVHHIRQHVKQKLGCDKCGLQFAGVQSSNHRCKDHGNDGNSVEMENPEEESRAIQTAPVETIDLAGASEDVDEDSTSIPVMTIPSGIESSIPSKEEQIQLISLTNPNALQFQNFLANDGSLRDGQPLFMRVLQQLGVGDDLEQAIPGISSDVMVKAKENPAKQMLTLAEDGSLEMVAVDCWNDESQNDRNPDAIL